MNALVSRLGPKMVQHHSVTHLNAVLTTRLSVIRQEGRDRTFLDIERTSGRYPRGTLHTTTFPYRSEIISFCSNDYLSMGQHPVVTSAIRAVLDATGAGSGGTRNISGTSPYHSALERELADLHQTDQALVFSSGFVANDTSLATLGRLLPGCVFFSDEGNHASLIEGIRRSGCEKQIFRHNDIDHLETLLIQSNPTAPKIIVFESVHSMDGSVAPIDEICALAYRYGAITFLDEVHAVGLYGDRGAGMTEHLTPLHRPTIISGTLSKGYGVYGGYIASTATIIHTVRSSAPGFIFTTALPPALAAGAIASIRHLKQTSLARTLLQQKVRRLQLLLTEAGIQFMSTATHIIPIIIGHPIECKRICHLLLSRHQIYVQPINYPTVTRGTERIRLTPGPAHTDAMLKTLVRGLTCVFREVGLKVDPPSRTGTDVVLIKN